MIINMMIKWSKKISRLSKFDIPAFTENMILLARTSIIS